MKKTLLSLAAACCLGFSASADVIVDKIQDFKDLDKFPFFVMGYEPEIIDGILTAQAPKNDDGEIEWYQFFVMDGLTFDTECEYTVTAKIKGSQPGSLNVQLGNWGALQERSLDFTDEWTEASVKVLGLTVTEGFSVFQPGTYPGKLEIEWIKLSHEGDPVVIPTEGNTVAEFYTGNGETFGGWGTGATFEQVEEDGKPCLKVTTTEKVNSWEVQMAINYDFTPGITYYIGFDIKGTEGRGISSGFQAARNYAGCGNMNTFDVTEEWNHVIIFGEPKEAPVEEGEEPNLPARWLANLGTYVGTFYMTNVTVYTADESGIANVAASVAAPAGVYNLMGIKVLDSAEPAALRNLPKGIYVVNGKKLAL